MLVSESSAIIQYHPHMLSTNHKSTFPPAYESIPFSPWSSHSLLRRAISVFCWGPMTHLCPFTNTAAVIVTANSLKNLRTVEFSQCLKSEHPKFWLLHWKVYIYSIYWKKTFQETELLSCKTSVCSPSLYYRYNLPSFHSQRKIHTIYKSEFFRSRFFLCTWSTS